MGAHLESKCVEPLVSVRFPSQVLPKMVEAKEGTILFSGATASLRGGTKFAQLAVPKLALRGLS